MYKYFFILAFSSSSHLARAQDFLFSQFYALPMSVNAAATGHFESGNQRVSFAYRGQWDELNASEGAYQGGLAAYEYRHCQKRNFWAVGGLIQAEGARFARYELVQIRLSGAFHYQLSQGMFAVVGAGGGILQYGVGLDGLRYDAQFVNPTGYNPALGSGESFPHDNRIRPDLNAGAQVYDATRGWAAGLAFTHLNRPEFSFLGEKNFLGTGLALHGTGTLWLAQSKKKAVLLRGLLYKQSVLGGNSRQWQALLGGFFKLTGQGFAQSSKSGQDSWLFSAGCMARFAGRTGKAGLIESLVPGLQLGWSGARLGLSYDLNVRKLAVPSAGRLELTLGWTFGNEDKCVFCPDF